MKVRRVARDHGQGEVHGPQEQAPPPRREHEQPEVEDQHAGDDAGVAAEPQPERPEAPVHVGHALAARAAGRHVRRRDEPLVAVRRLDAPVPRLLERDLARPLAAVGEPQRVQPVQLAGQDPGDQGQAHQAQEPGPGGAPRHGRLAAEERGGFVVGRAVLVAEVEVGSFCRAQYFHASGRAP